MSLQTHTSNMPIKEFSSKDFQSPLYAENTFIDCSDGKTYALDPKLVEEFLLWTNICAFHLSGEAPVMFGSPVYVFDEFPEIDRTESVADRLENFIAQRFLDLPLVEYVYLSIENDSIDIWTVINKLDREAREKIYDIEYDILGIFRDFQFDFHVICRNDRNIEEICPSNAKMTFSKHTA